jgi:SM-20-related protein
LLHLISDTRISELAEHGLTVIDLSQLPTLWLPLHDRLISLEHSSQLQDARIGGDGHSTRNDTIRSDATSWLDPSHATDRVWLDMLESVRSLLNHQLFLGLREVEAHFASYPEGGHYDWHWDNPPNSNRRRISSVLYLNRDWSNDFGGEFEYFDADQTVRKISPMGGHFVLFRSEMIKHRVAPARTRRRSVTAWFM